MPWWDVENSMVLDRERYDPQEQQVPFDIEDDEIEIEIEVDEDDDDGW